MQGIPEELFDSQADSYNNTIRWNVGHMIYWMDAYMKMGFSMDSAIPESYASFFNSGTSPASWTNIPPSKDELILQLSAQLNQISELSPESLEAPFETPLQFGPLTFHKVGSCLTSESSMKACILLPAIAY